MAREELAEVDPGIALPAATGEPRRDMYESERRFADRIRSAPPFSEERRALIAAMYDRAYAFHRDLIARGIIPPDQTVASMRHAAAGIHSLFRGRPGSLLELGCGNGALSVAIAKLGWRVTGIDAATEPIRAAEDSAREHGVSDRCRFVRDDITSHRPDDPVDCVFNKSVFEHLLPDEAGTVLRRWKAALRPEGWLLFTYANRLNGPHDVSQFFLPRGSRAQGSHFFETTVRETISALREASFTSFRCPLMAARDWWGPSWLRWSRLGLIKALALEGAMGALPARWRPISGFQMLVPMVMAAR